MFQVLLAWLENLEGSLSGLLDDLVRSGVDPVADNPVAPPPRASIDSGASLPNQPQNIPLDKQIHSILQRHMDAAHAEIMQLLHQRTKSNNKD